MDLMEARRRLMASMSGKVGQFTKYQKIPVTVTNGVLEANHTLSTIPKAVFVSVNDISNLAGNDIAYVCVYQGDTEYFAAGGIRKNGSSFTSFNGVTSNESTTVADKNILIGQNKVMFLSTSTVVTFPENVAYSIELYA